MGVRSMRGVAALATGLLLTLAAAAAPIAYTEGSTDQLSDDSNLPAQLGALGLGLNTIGGSIACSGISCSQGDDQDNFRVELVAGLQITEISLEIRRFSASGNDPGGRFVNYLGTLSQEIGFAAFEFSGDIGATTIFAGTAAGAGDLWLSVREFSAGNPIVQSWDYTIAIQVAASPSQPVPEPATMALVGAALLAMTGLAPRRPART